MEEKLIKQVEEMIIYWKGLEQQTGRSHKKEIEHCEAFIKEVESRESN